MTWYGFHVLLEGFGDKHATAAFVSQWAKRTFQHALNTCQPLMDPPDHAAEFHCTALYYSRTAEDKLRSADLEHSLAPSEPLCGRVAGVYAVGPIKTGDGDRYYVCLGYDCEPLQDYFLVLKKEAERVAGAPAAQRPHLGPANERCYKNDVNPHSTLATYDSKSALDADMAEMDKYGVACELLFDTDATPVLFRANVCAVKKRAIRLVDLHVNIKA